eukprot:2452992-Rhodomonas_salina.1
MSQSAALAIAPRRVMAQPESVLVIAAGETSDPNPVRVEGWRAAASILRHDLAVQNAVFGTQMAYGAMRALCEAWYGGSVWR